MGKAGKGAIVNISSLAAVAAAGNLTAYKLSKAAMNALTQNLALTNAKHGVRANAIMPGLMDTPMAVDAMARATGRAREQVAEARVTIEQVAAEHDREIDPEHFGALIPYTDGDIPDAMAAIVRARNADAQPSDIVATKATLPALIDRFCQHGFSKFVLIPVSEPRDWTAELEEVASIVRPLET